MTIYIIDAYAWIEYAIGSKKGLRVQEIIEDKENSINTNVITFSELSAYCERHKKDFTDLKKMILSMSSVYTIDVAFCEEAGSMHTKIRKERKHMGMIDVFILLTAKKLGGKVVTGDQDFKGLQNVILLLLFLQLL